MAASAWLLQINDQGQEFVNSVSVELHRLTGTIQRVMSPYHPKVNGLVETQNRKIRNLLIKLPHNNPSDWSYVIEDVLFAHRITKHASTKYSQSELLYNRKPVFIQFSSTQLL